MFSELKHTAENAEYYQQHIDLFKSMHHNNVAFMDEKAFILHSLLKQRLHRDPAIGETPQMVIPSEVNYRKRCNTTYSIRPFRPIKSNKTLR